MSRRHLSRIASVVVGLVCLVLVAPARAQLTRAEETDMARRDKQARLWPERESPMVRQANDLVERGFREGIEDGYGANGPQVVLGGMRSGHGMSFGAGYRKTDVWGERIGVRATGRMTVQGAYMADLRVTLQGLEFGRSFFNIYSKYEKSPRMDYYGLGPDSRVSDRSSYLLEDLSTDVQFGIALSDDWRVGFTGGYVSTDTGPGRRPNVPSATDQFTPAEVPGIGLGTIDFIRGGGFLVFDTRSTPSGTRRGGVYGVRWRKYADRTHDIFDFSQTEVELQQFVPYFNETHVVAFRAATTLSFQDEGQLVPVYFMPTIGGNNDLRGFARYRYHDNHSVFVSVEHRWYVFRGLDMAVFGDAGKVIPRKASLDFSDLEVTALRAVAADATVQRVRADGSNSLGDGARDDAGRGVPVGPDRPAHSRRPRVAARRTWAPRSCRHPGFTPGSLARRSRTAIGAGPTSPPNVSSRMPRVRARTSDATEPATAWRGQRMAGCSSWVETTIRSSCAGIASNRERSRPFYSSIPASNRRRSWHVEPATAKR